MECAVCRGTDFVVIDGVTFCSQCNAESQAHGQETVVNEDTIGVFSMHGSSFQTKTIGGSRSKKKKKPSLEEAHSSQSCSSIEAFTYILTGWIRDVQELGASSALSGVVTQLWAKYLRKLNLAFVDRTKRRPLCVRPPFRDIQTKLFPGKRFIHRNVVSLKLKSAARASKGKREADVSHLSARRLRRKRRNQFVDSLTISSDSEPGTQASTSSFYESDSSSFMSDFSLSFSQDSPDTSLTDKSMASASSSATSTSDEEGDTAPQDQSWSTDELRILNKVTRLSTNRPNLLCPKLINVFSLLALGLVLDSSALTLSDLLFWLHGEMVACKTVLQHLPDSIKLTSRDDYCMFTFSKYIVNHYRVRKAMSKMCLFIPLQHIYLPVHHTSAILQRFLQELCLPSSLQAVLSNALEHVQFLVPELYKPARSSAFFCIDLHVMALILFALKYLYGLDDETEYICSHNVRLFNEASQPRRFCICDWIRLSKQRLFLVVKYSHDLHARFSSLCPHVHMSNMTCLSAFQAQLRTADRIKRGYTAEAANDKLKDKFSELESYFRQCFLTDRLPCSPLDLSRSKTPLSDFTAFYTSHSLGPSELDQEEIECLKRLNRMTEEKLGMQESYPDAEEVELRGEWIPTIRMGDTLFKPKLRHVERTYSGRARRSLDQQGFLRYQPSYWSLKPSASLGLDRSGLDPADPDVISHVPESFEWILSYMAAYLSTTPSDLFVYVHQVEQQLLKGMPHYFGPVVKGMVKMLASESKVLLQ